jgi:nucleotide-binding universal stress UspA family protein
MTRIVVGIDGSDNAVAALRWAIGEARLRGATIDAIDAWNYPYVVVPGATIPLHPRADQAVDVEEELDAALAAVTSQADGVTINSIVTEGVPAAVLCEAAEGADLLVIGHGRHHALRKRVLGSVGTEVLQYAPCPVVIVSAEPPEE